MGNNICAHCANILLEGQDYCPKCGTFAGYQTAAPQAPVTEETFVQAVEPVAFVSADTDAAAPAAPTPFFKSKKFRTILIIAASALVLIFVLGMIFTFPQRQKKEEYQRAISEIDQKNYSSAIEILEPLAESNYKDCEELLLLAKYKTAAEFVYQKDYKNAERIYKELGDYRDSVEMVARCKIAYLNSLIAASDYSAFIKTINQSNEYKTIFAEKFSTKNKAKVVTYYLKKNPLSYDTLQKFNLTASTQIKFFEDIHYGTSYYKNLKQLYTCTNGVYYADSFANGFKKNRKKIAALWKFKPTRKIVQSDDCIASFLVGKWNSADGTYHFKFMTKGTFINTSYNFPWVDDSDFQYYEIRKNIYMFTRDKDNVTKNCFKFTLLDVNTMKIYCYKNGQTYTAYR